MIPSGGGRSAGGGGKRSSNGAIRMTPIGELAAATRMRIAASARARPKRACRPKQSNTPTSAPHNRRLIGEASIQNILEAMKNTGGALLRTAPLWQEPRLVARRAVAYLGPSIQGSAMKPLRDVVAAIGRTPLIKLRAASEATACTILGKAEFMNPGGSVKDRAALAIINDAIARGALRPGGVIVEGTAGNTGIGIAMVASALGYRTVIVIPDTQAQEKKDMLRLAGAELIEVPAVPYSNANNYVRYSGRLAEALAKTEPNGAVWANQFDNVANRRGHTETTGPEIYDDLGGAVHGFVSAVGTGGTLAGVGMALKERDPSIKIALADPLGAALYSFYTTGELKSSGSSITEGIGQGRVTANLEGAPVDFAYQIPDEEALPIVFDLVVQEGLLLGGSSGINIAGALRLARELGPGHTIVTLSVQFRRPLRFETLQSRLSALEEPARPGLAGSTRKRATKCSRNDAGAVSR